MNKTELVLAGSGGQGLVMMGMIMGRAASESGYNVSQTQSYGIAARGGVSYAEIVISDEEIIYPKATRPDLILTLTAETYYMFRKKYPEAVIVADDDELSVPAGDKHTISLPLIRYCREKGDMRILNMLSIGVVQGITNAIDDKALEETIAKRFPSARETNIMAYCKGLEMGHIAAGRRVL